MERLTDEATTTIREAVEGNAPPDLTVRTIEADERTERVVVMVNVGIGSGVEHTTRAGLSSGARNI